MLRLRAALSRLGLRVVLTTIGSLLLVGNFLVGPEELAVFDRGLSSDAEKSEGAECCPTDNISAVRAAGFALIGTGSLFINLLPKRREAERDKIDALADWFAQGFGLTAAGAAGWYGLDHATGGEPGPYLLILGTFAAVMAFYLLFAGLLAYLYSRMGMTLEAAGRLIRNSVSITMGQTLFSFLALFAVASWVIVIGNLAGVALFDPTLHPSIAAALPFARIVFVLSFLGGMFFAAFAWFRQ